MPKTTFLEIAAFAENSEHEASAEECLKASSSGSTAPVKSWEQAARTIGNASGGKASAEKCLRATSSGSTASVEAGKWAAFEVTETKVVCPFQSTVGGGKQHG